MRSVPFQRRSRVAVAFSLSAASHAGFLVWFAAKVSSQELLPSGEHMLPQPKAVQVRWMDAGPTARAVPALPRVMLAGAAPASLTRPVVAPAQAIAQQAGIALPAIDEPIEPTVPSVSFDVPPIPKEGWIIDSLALTSMPPGGPPPVVRIEVDVDLDGTIVGWQLLETNTDRDSILSLLRGIDTTAMVPAMRDGKPVSARFTVEFAFSD